MENKESKNKIAVGILAHVDAGKTTLAEAFLFLCGKTRTLGRVDHKDTYLDNFELERKRGITIFSKQARFSLPNTEITLLDTPGHADFAQEAERVLSVLDYAILVINGTDGVQSHTLTLWSLLGRYNIPTFIFVNKTDISDRSKEDLLRDITSKLSHRATDFTGNDHEAIASCDETLMESFLTELSLTDEQISVAIRDRHVFPVLFGSALKLDGVSELLNTIDRFTVSCEHDISAPFSARVYKISRDQYGQRLTHVKIETGSVRVRSMIGDEKVTQLRFYSGEKYDTREEAYAGEICTIVGLENTFAMQYIGEDGSTLTPLLSPVMAYRLILPPGTDVHHTFDRLAKIAEEIPELSLAFLEDTNEIQVQIMGEIQIEVLEYMIKEQLDLSVKFGVGTIIYKETVSGVTEGVGHFEPLRHYAEVHLKIEPGERNTGIQVFTDVSEDILDKNWQRLIRTHLLEKKHRGVLTGSLLTDVKITVIGGRSHPKHTEGGDFRQATYRAVRHGLMYNSSVLLEPWYDFMLEVPESQLGRLMSDIPKMYGTIKTHEIHDNNAIVYGRCPVSTMHGYAITVNSFTKGEGKLSVSSGGYDICHNPEEVAEKFHYDPTSDLRNTPDSVFCAHGSGFTVPWDQVTEYMHVEACLKKTPSVKSMSVEPINKPSSKTTRSENEPYSYSASAALDKDLAEIFNRTYGSRQKDGKRSDPYNPVRDHIVHPSLPEKTIIKESVAVSEYLLVDGYNIIFSWDDLSELSKTDLRSARQKLTDILCNYQGFRKMTLILVFDAYKVEGGQEKVETYKNITIVYTKEAETADRYIERTTKDLTRKHHVTVATSDATEQVIIWGSGAARMSARELREEIAATEENIRNITEQKATMSSNERLIDSVSKEVAKTLNEFRLEQNQ